jgi:hypothetical protein
VAPAVQGKTNQMIIHFAQIMLTEGTFNLGSLNGQVFLNGQNEVFIMLLYYPTLMMPMQELINYIKLYNFSGTTLIQEFPCLMIQVVWCYNPNLIVSLLPLVDSI